MSAWVKRKRKEEGKRVAGLKGGNWAGRLGPKGVAARLENWVGLVDWLGIQTGRLGELGCAWLGLRPARADGFNGLGRRGDSGPSPSSLFFSSLLLLWLTVLARVSAPSSFLCFLPFSHRRAAPTGPGRGARQGRRWRDGGRRRLGSSSSWVKQGQGRAGLPWRESGRGDGQWHG